MDFLQFLDMIVHVDEYLGSLVARYGTVVYVVLFAIVFWVLPFSPGDTLLFIAGTFCAAGLMNIWALMALLLIAAVACGYFFGNIPIIRDHLRTIVLVGVGAALIPLALGGLWKAYRKMFSS